MHVGPPSSLLHGGSGLVDDEGDAIVPHLLSQPARAAAIAVLALQKAAESSQLGVDLVEMALPMASLDRPPFGRSLGLCVVVGVVNELNPVLKYLLTMAVYEFGSNDSTEKADFLRNTRM